MPIPQECFQVDNVEFHTHPVRRPDGISSNIGPGQLTRVKKNHGSFGEHLPDEMDVATYNLEDHGPIDWEMATAITT